MSNWIQGWYIPHCLIYPTLFDTSYTVWYILHCLIYPTLFDTSYTVADVHCLQYRGRAFTCSMTWRNKQHSYTRKKNAVLIPTGRITKTGHTSSRVKAEDSNVTSSPHVLSCKNRKYLPFRWDSKPASWRAMTLKKWYDEWWVPHCISVISHNCTNL